MIDVKALSSLVQILPDKELQEKELETITMCQNQSSNFQLAFKINDKSAELLDFYIRFDTDLPLSLYYINNVPIISTCGVDINPPIGLYPDILLEKKVNPPLQDVHFPWGKFTVEEGEKTLLRAYHDSWQGVFICINEFEKNVKPGKREIKIELYNKNNHLAAKTYVTVDVLPLKLPRQKLLYTNWFHYDCISDIYGEEVFTDRYFEIIRDYIEKAARNGMNMILLPAFTPPLDTGVGDERMTVQLVKIKKVGKKYEFDFSLMKRFVDLCRNCGITHFEHAHFFTQWGAKNAPKIIVNVDGKDKKLFGWHTNSVGKAYADFLGQYLEALKVFLKEEKLEKNIMFHISDEPGEKQLEQYGKAREIVKKHLDGYKIGDAISHVEFFKRGYCDTPIAVTSSVHDFIGICDDLWAYYTGGSAMAGRSNRVLTIPRERNRVLGVQLYYHNIKGFLHWAYNNYYGEQSKHIFNPAFNPSGGFSLTGTSFIVYPDFNGKCLQSVRQKIFAECLSDIRLLSLLEKKCGKKACHEIIEKHFGVPNFNRSVKDIETFTAFIDEVYVNLKK